MLRCTVGPPVPTLDKTMNYILGLDLGSASLGWAVLECTEVDGSL